MEFLQFKNTKKGIQKMMFNICQYFFHALFTIFFKNEKNNKIL